MCTSAAPRSTSAQGPNSSKSSSTMLSFKLMLLQSLKLPAAGAKCSHYCSPYVECTIRKCWCWILISVCLRYSTVLYIQFRFRNRSTPWERNTVRSVSGQKRNVIKKTTAAIFEFKSHLLAFSCLSSRVMTWRNRSHLCHYKGTSPEVQQDQITSSKQSEAPSSYEWKQNPKIRCGRFNKMRIMLN